MPKDKYEPAVGPQSGMLRENCTNEERKADLLRLNQSTEVDLVHFVAVN